LRGLLEPCPLLRRHGDHQTLQSPVSRRHGSKHAGRGCAGTSACLGLALAYTPESYLCSTDEEEGIRQFLPALPRGYTDRYTQRYTEGPNMPRRSALPSHRDLPQHPSVGPSP
jgi:hypothetical protein